MESKLDKLRTRRSLLETQLDAERRESAHCAENVDDLKQNLDGIDARLGNAQVEWPVDVFRTLGDIPKAFPILFKNSDFLLDADRNMQALRGLRDQLESSRIDFGFQKEMATAERLRVKLELDREKRYLTTTERNIAETQSRLEELQDGILAMDKIKKALEMLES